MALFIWTILFRGPGAGGRWLMVGESTVSGRLRKVSLMDAGVADNGRGGGL
jgi:hypothetical protein